MDRSEPCAKCRRLVYASAWHTCPNEACYYHIPCAAAPPSPAQQARPDGGADILGASEFAAVLNANESLRVKVFSMLDPTLAPDVARLVEAMKKLMRGYEARMGEWENPEFNDEYNEAVEALAPFRDSGA